ncbi:MAG TPA: protein translocase subunit SecF [Ktedonobacteraceae bacterium]|nr:protein translocase subunit SecF [Ktedonobacteraceae bacterium]
MFDLVGKRYLFILISLIVIVPGTISLIVKGLNVGIDFVGGANVEYRPEKAVTIPEMTALVAPFKLEDLQIVTGDNPQLAAGDTIWIRFNTEIDSNVQKAITSDLQAKYGTQLAINYDNLILQPVSGQGHTSRVTVATATKFNSGVTPNVNDIRATLSKIPPTSDPTKGPATVAAATPTATTTNTPTASPTAKANATPASGQGPTVAATPTLTPTTTPTTQSNPANIPVEVVDVTQGTTTQTVTLLTRSELSSNTLLQMQAHFINSGIYMQQLGTAVVSGSVASETTRNAFLAVLAASGFILLWIWFSFRKVDRPWRYGTSAIVALLHDVLVVLGVFSILGWLVGLQIDALFITALLTVVGFSVHDTIVVFDRIRENMQRRTSETFDQVVNASLVQTMARSLNTSLTVIFTLTALTLFGGSTIRPFTLALLIGIVSGTYSSIFNASMVLVMWDKGELNVRRFFRRDRSLDKRDKQEERELARTRG